MLRNLVLFALFLCAAFALPSQASSSENWLRLYQYRKISANKYRSDITSPQFFFSEDGRNHPEKEMQAAIDAFSSTEKLYGTQKQPAACVFPLRKIIIEKILNRKFPDAECTDLKKWMDRINADQASLVFVGAYPGNPASILGHTFLRLSNSVREKSGRDGIDLLSYSVGFMAITNPGDNRMLYMLKGLTGRYDGFYEIEPHYMKVGIYNNSESRDLWDLKLALTPEQVRQLVLYIWELTFNSKTPYYFIDENCSYRLLKLIEVVDPNANVSDKLSTVVLPAETVRASIEARITEGELQFRPSVKRRLTYKLNLLDPKMRAQTLDARDSVERTKALADPTALDALLDYWLYENYRAHTNLDPKQKEIMEATYTAAAHTKGVSKFKNIRNQQIREEEKLIPPFLGHKPSWIEIAAGRTEKNWTGDLRYRSGAHPFWSGDSGYNDTSEIEYLGADIEFQDSRNPHWNLLLINVRSLNDFADWDHRLSWSFSVEATNHCLLCNTEQPQAKVTGGAGFSTKLSSTVFYLLAHVIGTAWSDDGTQGLLAPGLLVGSKTTMGLSTLTFEFGEHWWKKNRSPVWDSRYTYAYQTNRNVFIRAQKELDFQYTAGLALFF